MFRFSRLLSSLMLPGFRYLAIFSAFLLGPESHAGNICFAGAGNLNKGSFPGAICVPKTSLKLVNQNWLSNSHLKFAKFLPQHKALYAESTGYVLSARKGEANVGAEACTPSAFAMALSVVYGTAKDPTNADWTSTSACGKSHDSTSNWESVECAIQWTSYLMNRGPEQPTVEARNAIYTKAIDWMGRFLGTCLNCPVKGTLWNAKDLNKGAGKMANPAFIRDAYTPKDPSPASSRFLFDRAFNANFSANHIINEINADSQIVASVMLTPFFAGESNVQAVDRLIPNPIKPGEQIFATVAGVPDPARTDRNTLSHAIVISGYQVTNFFGSPLIHIADPLDGQWKIGQLGTIKSGFVDENVAIRIMTARGFPLNIPVPGIPDLNALLKTPQNILTGLTVQATKIGSTVPSPTECIWNARMATADLTVEHPAFNLGSCGTFLDDVPYIYYKNDSGFNNPPNTIDGLSQAYSKATSPSKISGTFDFRQRVSFLINGISLRIK